ncbi:MAG TPA: hypothetical protein VGI46_16395 [Candidatus Acidoferrum sp.]|jgi:hypothetical protein
MAEEPQLKNAINGSIKLFESDGLPVALRLLDDAIAEFARQGLNLPVTTLCHHAAVLCSVAESLPLQRHYFELSLTHNPGNFRALYGLARVSLDEGQTDLARKYAQQSVDAIMASDDPLAHSWLELIDKNWPGLVRPPQA